MIVEFEDNGVSGFGELMINIYYGYMVEVMIEVLECVCDMIEMVVWDYLEEFWM